MRESRFELAVGDSMRLDDQILTVIDINDDEITFRLDAADELESDSAFCGNDAAGAAGTAKRLPPR